MAVNRIIYSWQELSLSLCDLGTSFICKRRAERYPKLLDTTECRRPVQWNAVADSRFGPLVIRRRIQWNSAMGNAADPEFNTCGEVLSKM